MVDLFDIYIGKEQWSPEQLKNRCILYNIDMVCVETIYKYIYYTDKPNQGTLHLQLRQAHRYRRRRKNSKDKRGIIKNRTSIHDRPMIVNEQKRFGDLEADTMIGKGHKSQIATIVDRKSLLTLIVPIKSKESTHVAKEIVKNLKPYQDRIHTITFDNGKEFAGHENISSELGIKSYFADPNSAWQRGCNENTNGLIRQYLPKGKDFNTVSYDELFTIQEKLNNRPRKKLNYRTPNEVFY